MNSLLTALAIVALGGGPPAADSGRFAEGDLEKTLSAAGSQSTIVVFHAAWCSPCKELHKRVLSQDTGRALLAGARGILVDFDSPQGQKLTARYTVLGLPSTLILGPDGKERARIQGFESPESWLESVRSALSGTDELAELVKQLADEPGDRTLIVRVAEARLFRGQVEPARKALFEQLRQGGTPGVDAGRIWGRYLVRVKRDGVRGAAHFKTLVERFSEHKGAAGFRYWAAVGHHTAGEKGAALSVFDEWIAAEPRNDSATLLKADFMVQFRYDGAREAVQAAIAVNPEDSWPHYLMAELELRDGNRTESVAAIRRAMNMERGKALYEFFATRRLGLELP